MIKKLSLFLAFIMIFSLFTLPVQAEETVTDLKRIHTTLKTYLYVPDYEESEYYPAYDALMTRVENFLASDTKTKAEVSRYYNELRIAYSNMMRDTYDYSLLEDVVFAFNQLDSALFTPESFKKVQSIYDSVQEELSAPTLFGRGKKTTSEQYTEHTNNHIKSFSDSFTTAFNGLVLKGKVSVNATTLSSYTKFVRFCSRQELMGGTPEWDTLQSALTTAERLSAGGSTAELESALTGLQSAYKAAGDASLDFAVAKAALDTYKDLRPENFTVPTWNRYAQTITDLETSLSFPQFFYIPTGSDAETCKEYAKIYLDSMANNANEKYDELIPIEDYQKLSTLCEETKNLKVREGLELKLEDIQNKIKAGKEILKNENAVKADVNKAITDIEEAVEALNFAEKHLIQEEANEVSHNTKTVRCTLIFVLSSLVIAAAIAMILSRNYYGKVNWSK